MKHVFSTSIAGRPTFKCRAEQKARALSPRKEQVLIAIKAGMTEREAADKLGVSHHTVHSHVMAVYQRMGVKSRAQLLSRLSSNGVDRSTVVTSDAATWLKQAVVSTVDGPDVQVPAQSRL